MRSPQGQETAQKLPVGARTPYVDGPPPRKVFAVVLIRSPAPISVGALAHERWPMWFCDESSKQSCDPIEGHGGARSVPRRGSIDHTICSLSCKFWHRLSTVAVQLAPVSG
jgi:hypothetical protein